MQKMFKRQRPLQLKPFLCLGALALASQINPLPAHADAYGPAIVIDTPSNGLVYTLLANEGRYVSGRVSDPDGINRVTVIIRRYSDGAYWNWAINNWQYPSAVVPVTYTPTSSNGNITTGSIYEAYAGPSRAIITSSDRYLIYVEAVDLLGNRSVQQYNVIGVD